MFTFLHFSPEYLTIRTCCPSLSKKTNSLLIESATAEEIESGGPELSEVSPLRHVSTAVIITRRYANAAWRRLNISYE